MLAENPTHVSAAPLATIDGQAINIATQRELMQRIVERARSHDGFTLFTLNLDHVVKRRVSPDFVQAYGRATFVSADGWPLVRLARQQGATIERVTGADLVLPVCEAARDEGLPLFFFGATNESLALAATELTRRFPGLVIAGMEAPPLGFDPLSDAAAAAGGRIGASGARFCFVALGAPKQEMFADRMALICPHVGFLCIGAALDFISGGQRRAPKIWQAARIEWLWRLSHNPRRLAGRYWQCALVFFDLAILHPVRRVAAHPAGKRRADLKSRQR